MFLTYSCRFQHLFQKKKIRKKNKNKNKFLIFSDLIIIMGGRSPIWKLETLLLSNPFFLIIWSIIILLIQLSIFLCFVSKLLNEWLGFILEIQWLILIYFAFKPKKIFTYK
jgi:hypothetical protein